MRNSKDAKCDCLGCFKKGEWIRTLIDPFCFWHGGSVEAVSEAKTG